MDVHSDTHSEGCDDLIVRDIFPTKIAQKHLSPSQADIKLMHGFMTRYERMEANVAPTDSPATLLTGDTTGTASIHSASEFTWLTKQVEILAYDYLRALGFDHNNLSVFHQKSWPVVTRRGGVVAPHDHSNANISAVFYLMCEPDEGGELIFEAPNPPLIPGTIDGKSCRKRSMDIFGFKPTAHMLVIFPSALSHQVLEYRGSHSRWSVSYDITVTAGKTLGAGRSENMVVHPSNWVEFSTTSHA